MYIMKDAIYGVTNFSIRCNNVWSRQDVESTWNIISFDIATNENVPFSITLHYDMTLRIETLMQD